MLLAWLGIVWNLRTPPKQIYEQLSLQSADKTSQVTKIGDSDVD